MKWSVKYGMYEHKLFEYKSTIAANLNIKEIEVELKSSIIDEYIYSFIVTIKTDDDLKIITYQIKHMVADEQENNTIFVLDAVRIILNAIIEYRDYRGKNRVIAYGQPPLELMIELYEPLIETLAKNVQNNWQQYELDDLKQMCRLSMCKLYNKGYYVHKSLLKKVFEREVLEEVRGLKKRGDVISLFTRIVTDDPNGEKLTIKDTLEDVDSTLMEEERLRLESELLIFNELKDIIIDKIGQRKWDMIFRDYSRGHTTSTSQGIMREVKKFLQSEGYTRNLFNERYH